jgi:hypothetical protein
MPFVRTLGAFLLVCAIAGSAWAQRHLEGVEPTYHGQKIALVQNQATQAALALEGQRERQRGLLLDLVSSDRGHWEQQQIAASIRTIRMNSHEIEVRHRERRSYAAESRARQQRQQLFSYNIRRLPRLKPTPRVRPDSRRVRPLTPRDFGRVRPGGGPVTTGTRSVVIRFVPPGG